MEVALFWWLQAQDFYKNLHRSASDFVPDANKTRTQSKQPSWADIGCGIGLMSYFADTKGYQVHSFDYNKKMIYWAKVLHRKHPNLSFKQEDVMNLTQKYDVVSATSLLSVVENKEAVLAKLLTLLKDTNSRLILIEPTDKMCVENVWKMIRNLKDFMAFKLLLVWANARQGKAIDIKLFDAIPNVTHHYFLNNMVRVTIICQPNTI